MEQENNNLKQTKIRTPFSEFWRKFKAHKTALASGIGVVLIILMAIFAPLIAPYPFDQPDYNSLLSPPSLKHWAGTDSFGRDILSRIILGSRISLAVGVCSVTMGAVFGIIIGIIGGYFGGKLDVFLMRFCDILIAFPGMLLAIGIVAILGPGIVNVVIAVSIFSVPIFARIVRGSTLALKETVYVEAAHSLGAPHKRIMFRHILPGTLAGSIVYYSMRIGTSILTAAGLSFIGLGAQPPTPEWGAMLASGRTYVGVAPHVTLYPGLAIFITVLLFNLLGDGLRDALDPKIDTNN